MICMLVFLPAYLEKNIMENTLKYHNRKQRHHGGYYELSGTP